MSQIIRELIRQVRLILNSRYEAALNHATYDTAHSLAFEGWDALSRGLLILFQLAASPLYDDQGFALPTQPEQFLVVNQTRAPSNGRLRVDISRLCGSLCGKCSPLIAIIQKK